MRILCLTCNSKKNTSTTVLYTVLPGLWINPYLTENFTLGGIMLYRSRSFVIPDSESNLIRKRNVT